MVTEGWSFFGEVEKDIKHAIRRRAVRLAGWLINHFAINPKEFWPEKTLRQLNVPNGNGRELCRTMMLRGNPCSVFFDFKTGGMLHVRVITADHIDRYFLLQEINRLVEVVWADCLTLVSTDRVIIARRSPNVNLLDLATELHHRVKQLVDIIEIFLTLPQRAKEYSQTPATV